MWVRFSPCLLTVIKFNNMRKIRKYVKSKPLHLVILEVYAFGVLLPLAVSGILFMFHQVIFVGVWFSLTNIIMI